MKKFLQSDWLRAVQFFVNTVQRENINAKRTQGNKMQR